MDKSSCVTLEQVINKLQKNFEKSLEACESPLDMVRLRHQYLGPKGIITSCLNEYPLKLNNAQAYREAVGNIFSFKCMVRTILFLQGIDPEIVSDWAKQQKHTESSPFAVSDSLVKKVEEEYLKEGEKERSLGDHSVIGSFLGMNGRIQAEWEKLEGVDETTYLRRGVDLLRLETMIEADLFMNVRVTTFQLGAERNIAWGETDVFVKQVEFETDLASCTTDADCERIWTKYLGQKGVVSSRLRQIKEEKQEESSLYVELNHLAQLMDQLLEKAGHKQKSR